MKTNVSNHKTKRLLAFFMALIMALTSFPLLAFATDESGLRPADGESSGSPFVSGEPSDYYRIPNLVTMNDGTLVAQADARWTADIADGGGNDSITAYSDDNGNTWNYSMLTYYPDNGNTFNRSSTSVCDSALATDGKTLYSLTTFFPAGYALNSTSANNVVVSDTAFNSDGKIRLNRNSTSDYGYYLDSFTSDDENGVAYIYSNDGTQINNYYVDHDFYLYNNGQKSGNLFYSDCEFQTVKTTFLMFRTSTDGGKSWSPFKLLNVKTSSESFYGVGPGRGVVTNQGHIIFGCYSWSGSNSSQRASFIYSTDGGSTWKRTANFGALKFWSFKADWTSECQPVDLGNGTIRLFARSDRERMIYGDAVYNSATGEYVWQNGVDSDGDLLGNGGPIHLDSEFNGEYFNISSNCQYSVIKYSKKVLWNSNYYTMLIASSGNNNTRTNVRGEDTNRAFGTLTFLLMDDSNNFVNAVQYQFSSGGFAYSCLTELSDGRIAVLWEDDDTYTTMRYSVFNVEETSGFRIPDLNRTYDLNLVKGDSQTFQVDEKTYTNTDPSIADAEFTENYSSTASFGTDSTFSGDSIPLTDALYTFTQTADGTWYVGNMGVYLTIDTPGHPSTKDREAIRINHIDGGYYFQFIDSHNEALYFSNSGDNIYQFDQTTAYGTDGSDGSQHYSQTLFEIYRPTRVGEGTGSSEVPGYVRVSDMSEVQDGRQYLIGCRVNGEYYFLYPALSPNNVYANTIKCNVDYVLDGYDMTVTALAGGTTTIVCGLNTYNIEVSDYSREITGVVDYDPVIYTHAADDITGVGSVISEGILEGEKVTEYRLNDSSYTIIDVVPVESFGNESPLSDSDITPSNTTSDGKLTGTLSLANTDSYISYESGTVVTLKTTLQDSTGLIWTQTDRLYVASNPVPGHVIVGNFNRRSNWGSAGGINLATYVMAYDSYGNTTMTTNANGINNYVGNALKLYPTASDYFTYNNAIGEIINTTSNTGDYKFAGTGENGSYEGWGNQSHTINYLSGVTADTVTVAYYYYDKSSDKNEGITAGSDPTSFSINMERLPVNSQYSSDEAWTKNVSINSSSVTKLSGSGSITNNTSLFGSGNYTILDSNHRKTGTIQLSTVQDNTDMIQPNTTDFLKGVVQYQETAARTDGRATSVNNVSLTFEVKMCDKSNERTPYDEAVSKVRKSTWYTTDTWYNYMQALLITQEYLNDYTLLTTHDTRTYNTNSEGKYVSYDEYLYYNDQSTVDITFNGLQKRADFTPLEEALENYQDEYDAGIVLGDGTHYTPDSYQKFVDAYVAGEEFINDPANAEELRDNLAGYVVGPDTVTTVDSNRLKLQEDIDNLADAINGSNLQIAADDSAYVAAKEESERIDLTAYKDNGDKIQEIKDTSDGLIYKEYPKNSGITYVNIPYDIDNGPEDTVTDDGQQAVDGYTKDLLTEMNVGSDASSPQVRTFHVDYNINGVDNNTDETAAGEVTNNDYTYGETAHIDLTQYNSDQYTVKCTVTSETGGKTPTTVNLEDCGYMLSILIQENITVDVEVTENEVITVEDYYGTVIGMAYIPEAGATVTIDAENNLIINETIIAPKPSPRYRFTSWSVDNGTVITEETVIRQRGVLNQGIEKIITAVNGTVNNKTEFRTLYLNLKLDLNAPEGNVWTRTVGGIEYLASYENSFVAFSSDEDVIYTAYNPSELPDTVSNQYINQIPAIYGTGYFTNNMFTLSIDYSAPQLDEASGTGVKVVETGIICSNTDTASTDETLVKGGPGAVTVPSNRISHWSGHDNSGTYTMTLANSDTGTYYMRAYVAYTRDYNGEATVPYVVYSDRIFKCEDGHVTAVN